MVSTAQAGKTSKLKVMMAINNVKKPVIKNARPDTWSFIIKIPPFQNLSENIKKPMGNFGVG